MSSYAKRHSAPTAQHPPKDTLTVQDVVRVFAYESDQDFMKDLADVLEEDYGVHLMGVQLEEAGRNVNQYLRSFLS